MYTFFFIFCQCSEVCFWHHPVEISWSLVQHGTSWGSRAGWRNAAASKDLRWWFAAAVTFFVTKSSGDQVTPHLIISYIMSSHVIRSFPPMAGLHGHSNQFWNMDQGVVAQACGTSPGRSRNGGFHRFGCFNIFLCFSPPLWWKSKSQNSIEELHAIEIQQTYASDFSWSQ